MTLDRLLPVLRNLSEDMFSRNGLLRAVAPGLAVFLAEVAPTPTNKIGIEYVLRNQLPQKTGSDDQLFDIAFKNLITGLLVDVVNLGHGQCYRLHRAGGCGAAAIALPDFVKMASSWCGTQEMLVCIEDVSHVWVSSR